MYRLIKDEDLSRYYDLKDRSSSPVGSSVFAETNFAWLDPLIESAPRPNGRSELKLAVSGLSCVGCVWLIERLFNAEPGAGSCCVNPQRGSIALTWDRETLDLSQFAQRLSRFGYQLSPLSVRAASESSKLTWRIGLCGALALNSMLYTLPSYLGMDKAFTFAQHFAWLSAIFASGSLLAGGSFFILKAVRSFRSKVIDLDLPIAIGLLAAYGISWYGFLGSIDSLVYFDFVSTFVFLMLCGRWIQVRAIEHNKRRLARFDIGTPTVTLEDSREQAASPAEASELVPGQRYRIKPGQMVPVASRLLSPSAYLGLDWINGESDTAIATQFQELPAGAI